MLMSLGFKAAKFGLHRLFLFRFAVRQVSNSLEAQLTFYWPKGTEKLYRLGGLAKYLKGVF